MTTIRESEQIAGVYLADLKAYADQRGRFLETFRKEWFPHRSWSIVQTNRSDSGSGVIRGLHYHFHQVDYWVVVRGQIRAALADIRRDSPTALATQTIDMGEDRDLGLFVPVGVAHGFAALTDATLTYLVDNYYDSSDEYGIAWNDPQLGLDWGVENPTLSDRDLANPHLADVSPERRPLYRQASRTEQRTS